MPKEKKIIFLDRDGVLNALIERDGKMVSPRLFQDFRFLEGVGNAIQVLCQRKYEVVVVTNQPDISRGLMLQTELDRMTRAVLALGVQQVLVCPHSDEDACLCRKPKPGLLTQYLESLDCKPTDIWMIGDREVDIEAGGLVGAKLIRVDSHPDQTTNANFRCSSLVEAVCVIVDIGEK